MIAAALTRVRRRLRSQAGFTLLEMLIAMSLLTIVVVIFLSALATSQTTVNRSTARSVSNDQSRLAMQELDREIRSGNVLYDPANCPPPPVDPLGGPTCDPAEGITGNMTLLIYTQTNANSRNPGNQCVQWRISAVSADGLSQLQRRAWSVNWQNDGILFGWRVVAENVVNRQPPDGSPAVPAFTLDPTSAFGSRVVEVNILTNGDPANGESPTVTNTTELTGRNTEYGYPSNICTTIPPY
jgi:prepilin-type N-terminal cleavage/methylation domain-containing protein